MSRNIITTTVLLFAVISLVLTSCVETGTIDVVGAPTMDIKSTEPGKDPTPTDVDPPEGITPSPELEAKDLPKLTPVPTGTNLPIDLVDSLERKLVILAQEDLADRYGLDLKDIQLVSIEPVTWPDSSLGCPQPNMFYTQVLSPGYRIIFETGEKIYSYHTDKNAEIIFCDLTWPTNFKETPSTRD